MFIQADEARTNVFEFLGDMIPKNHFDLEIVFDKIAYRRNEIAIACNQNDYIGCSVHLFVSVFYHRRHNSRINLFFFICDVSIFEDKLESGLLSILPDRVIWWWT